MLAQPTTSKINCIFEREKQANILFNCISTDELTKPEPKTTELAYRSITELAKCYCK